MKPALPVIVHGLVLCLLNALPASAQDIYAARYKAVFTTPPRQVPTAKVPDAPLAGNGDIGLTLGGTPGSLDFYLGKNDFWRAWPVYPGGGIAFPGGLEVNIPALQGASWYAEQVMDKAQIIGRFVNGDTVVSLTAWVAAAKNTVVLEWETTHACRAQLRLYTPKGNNSVTGAGKQGDVQWVSRSFLKDTSLQEWPCHVAIALKTLGAATGAGNTLALQPGKKVIFILTLYSSFDTPQWKAQAIRQAAAITAPAIGQLRTDHERWWRQFWSRSSVQIGDPYLEQYYYASQYLLACASRGNKCAPGIWGPFITKDSTAWGGDYHLNYNYQAPYWAAYSSNQIELTDNFDQPLLDYMEKGKAHARDLLQMRGIYYPVGIGPRGLVTTRWPLTPEEMEKRYGTRENTIDSGYKFLGQKINAVFSAANMLMRFYSTYDRAYAERVYPYLLECANFWEDYLQFENGRYVIYMDHFNEVMPRLGSAGNWRDRLGDFNSTLSLGLVKMLFKGMVSMSSWLRKDASRQEKWQHIATHLSAFPVGEVDGRPSLQSVERRPWGAERAAGLNRVSIHGLLVPAGVAGPRSDSAFNQILLGDVRHWKDRMKSPGEWGNTLNNGIETCFPGAVRVGFDPDSILTYLKARIAMQSLPNLWITQGGGGIETLAAVPLTINEMLLQSYEQVIRVFPNWDPSRDAQFDHLRAYGAFLVSSRLEKGRVSYVQIISEKGLHCRLENPWPGKMMKVFRNGVQIDNREGPVVTIRTSVNDTIRLEAL